MGSNGYGNLIISILGKIVEIVESSYLLLMVFFEGFFMYFVYGVGYVIVVGVCVIIFKVFFDISIVFIKDSNNEYKFKYKED